MKNPGRYKIIYNYDGGMLFVPFAPVTDEPFTVEKFLEKTVDHLVDTQVDAMVWTLGTDHGTRIRAEIGPGRASNLYCHETDVGERFYELAPPYQSYAWHVQARRVKKMIDEGNDPPKVLAEYAHKRGLDVLLGFRMNDCHDGRNSTKDNDLFVHGEFPMRFPVFEDGRFNRENIRGYFCKAKLEHPELLIGEHKELSRQMFTAFDYAHREVRDFRLALIEEAVRKYDTDGVELDFLRAPVYFKPGEEIDNCGLMTEFMGEIRDALDRAGKSRGKRLKLAIRAVAPLEESKAIGLDVQTWIDKGYLDVVIAGITNRSVFDLSAIVREAHKHNCPVYASIKADTYAGYGNTPEVFRGIAANHYRAGADGMHLFNMYSLRDSGAGTRDYDFQPLREIGSFETIRHMDKTYPQDALKRSQYAEWTEEMQSRVIRSVRGTLHAKPQLPAGLREGEDLRIHFHVADDAEEAAARNMGLDIVLGLVLQNLTGGAHGLRIAVNGNAVSEQELAGKLAHRVDVPVAASICRCGANVLKLALARKDPDVLSEMTLDHMEVRTKYRTIEQ